MARYDVEGDDLLLYLAEDDVELLQHLVDQLGELLAEDDEEPLTSPDAASPETTRSRPTSPGTTRSGDPDTDPPDPFAAWEAELGESPQEPEPLTDPALQRLFPNPYPHDAEAASDHRRFSERQQRREKLGDLGVLSEALSSTPLRIRPEDQTPWLRSLNALRLVLASRLGIEDDETMEHLQQLPEDDPRVMMVAVMDWLANLQYLIIELAPRF